MYFVACGRRLQGARCLCRMYSYALLLRGGGRLLEALSVSHKIALCMGAMLRVANFRANK